MKQKLWNRNFTMVVIGQVISLFANNILHFALSLYVLDLTGSSAWFGTVMAVSMLPVVFLMPFGGVAADRINKRNMMVGMDLLTGAAALVTGLLVFGGRPLLVITGYLIVLSVIEAFYTPCVQASIPALQEKENLVRANAIVNQIAMSSNIIGPVLAGVIYGFVGLAPVIWVSVICFLSAAAMEAFIAIPFEKQEAAAGMADLIKKDLSEGFRYATKEQPDLIKIMPAIALVNFSVSAVVTVGGPFIVRIMLGLSSQHYGFSTGCIAAAGVLGGMATALLANRLRLENTYQMLMFAGASLLPLAAACFTGVSGTALFVVMTGCFMAIQLFASIFSIFTMSVIQMKLPGHLIGKIYAFMVTVAICAEPLGRGIYGFAFEFLTGRTELVLLVTAAATMLAGYTIKEPLRRMGK